MVQYGNRVKWNQVEPSRSMVECNRGKQSEAEPSKVMVECNRIKVQFSRAK